MPTRTTHRPRRPAPHGITIVEVLVALACVLVLAAAAPVFMQSTGDRARIAQSVANLKNLAAAQEAYSGDWNDRQFTPIPDDAGLAGGECAKYIETIGCPSPQLLGFDTDGAMWGYFLGAAGKCAPSQYPGSCDNWAAYTPIAFDGPHAGFGAFRLSNVVGFNRYVTRRFYDPIFYAPHDTLATKRVQKHFKQPAEFAYADGEFAFSSYCWSPAAMWDTQVLARNGKTLNGQGFTDPKSLKTAFRSPSVSRCVYPSLKTRTMEHDWLQGKPSVELNPAFVEPTQWFFNHSVDSKPATLFFDGHIELVGCDRAMADDARAGGLWSRNTPFGADGYFGAQAFDRLVKTSFHILTTDGIEGRDILQVSDSNGPAAAPGAAKLNAPGEMLKLGSTKTEKPE